MGRPEWIVIAVVLSVGLIGAVATTVANAWSAVSDGLVSVSIDEDGVDDERTSPDAVEADPPTRTLAGIGLAPIPMVPITGMGGDGNVLWLLGGGVIGFLLVAALAVVRYSGIPAGTDDEPASASPAYVASQEDADVALQEQHQPESIDDDDGPVADDRRVRELLEEGGGRMKQTAIVEGTEWSKSKVSMLLSEMEDDGEIKKIQVGRENIIALEGHEPEAANSPFDDAE